MAVAGVNLLIAGTSHVGKTTLANAVGEALGWPVFSTDAMARHPGRPWPTVPAHVAEFYAALSDQSIYQFLLNHHENMWRGLKGMLSESAGRGVYEGSALRPDYIATLPKAQNISICLYADADFLRDRIYRESGYSERSTDQQRLIDTFTNRSVTDNAAHLRAARDAGIECVDVTNDTAPAEAKEWLMAQVDAAQTKAVGFTHPT